MGEPDIENKDVEDVLLNSRVDYSSSYDTKQGCRFYTLKAQDMEKLFEYIKSTVVPKDELLQIIQDEIKEIQQMKPDEDEAENEISFETRKQHWISECHAIERKIYSK